MAMQAKRVISGTWGEVWIDGEKVAEVTGLQLKSSYQKESVHICGQMASDKKLVGIDNTGSLRLHKANSRMAIIHGEAAKQGRDARFVLVSKLADPDAYGAERVQVTGVSFDDLTLADWEAKALGKMECPFTFTDYELLDKIEPES